MEERRTVVDTSFNFTTDTPPGLDPDRWSPTLHRYHQVLWGRDLPNGQHFQLEDGRPLGWYLLHKSHDGREFWLSSEAVIHTFTRWKRPDVRRVVEQAAEHDRQHFYVMSYTIGGMVLFPGSRIDRMWTLNQARGCLKKIADRFDLTLECIRRHYKGQVSPLGEVLGRYGDFFRLFEAFDGYVEHFLLHDLVAEDGTVRFFLPFDDFERSPLPQDIREYTDYRELSVEFVRRRNERIDWLVPELAG